MASKKTNENPDNLDFTEEELETLDIVRKNQAQISAGQADNKVRVPTLANFIARNRTKLEKGATLGGNFIRLKYAEKLLVEDA